MPTCGPADVGMGWKEKGDGRDVPYFPAVRFGRVRCGLLLA